MKACKKPRASALEGADFKLFHYKKALYGDETEVEVVLVDVSESPVERPKKTRKDAIAAKRIVTPKRPS